MSSLTQHQKRRPQHLTPTPRWRRLLSKSRRLGQIALFAAVRGAAYTLGTAASAWLIYWITHR